MAETRRWASIAIIAIVIGALTISIALANAYPLAVCDDFGREVTIEKKPERIISMCPSNTEVLFAIGAGDRVVGVTEYCEYPPKIMEMKEKGELEVIGGYTTPSIEEIVALDPDLILAHDLTQKEVFYRLEELNYTVFVIESAKSINGTLEDIQVIGKMVGEEETASELVERMEERIEGIINKTGRAEKPKVAHIAWHEPLWVCGREEFADDLIEIVGGENIFSDKKGWTTVSLEELIERNPDVIIVPIGHGAAGDKPFWFFFEEERLRDVSAVENGRIYPIDADIVSRSGPRIVQALEEFAIDIHPETGIEESFSISNLSVIPRYAGKGENITVSVDVENDKKEAGEKIIVLKVDEKPVDMKKIFLDGGESKRINFTIPAEGIGKHEIVIDGERGSYEVTRKEIPGFTAVSLAAGVLIAMYLLRRDGRRREGQ